jgi:hypothetical protein
MQFLAILETFLSFFGSSVPLTTTFTCQGASHAGGKNINIYGWNIAFKSTPNSIRSRWAVARKTGDELGWGCLQALYVATKISKSIVHKMTDGQHSQKFSIIFPTYASSLICLCFYDYHRVSEPRLSSGNVNNWKTQSTFPDRSS